MYGDPFEDIQLVRERLSLYLSLFLLLKALETGERLPEEVKDFLKEKEQKLLSLIKKRKLLKDKTVKLKARYLKPNVKEFSRGLIPKTLMEFYSREGYEITDIEPDSLTAMFGFIAAKLQEELYLLEIGNFADARKNEMAQLRFLNTHLLPVLSSASLSKDLSEVTEPILRIVSEDRNQLLKRVVSSFNKET
ncbi:hypothetical protein BCF55_1478 [Hydrogenivirga caldilitoris]|uniref:Uncharacterized protein n=1 Tax=Hydrogenivirga caldilitoris TaxID=246264 RepID=A0A497XSU9_9AQUI|nr:hypothetical protein [Hydrogenivirga caldilitoris]RLJ71179.1 hypothetical protein BCF55_1478 [Hydrogenivirga caldilitoris]